MHRSRWHCEQSFANDLPDNDSIESFVWEFMLIILESRSRTIRFFEPIVCERWINFRTKKCRIIRIDQRWLFEKLFANDSLYVRFYKAVRERFDFFNQSFADVESFLERFSSESRELISVSISKSHSRTIRCFELIVCERWIIFKTN